MARRAAQRFALLLAMLGVLLLAQGCGERKVADPLAEALSYLPADSPLVMKFATDGVGLDRARAIAARFPFLDEVKSDALRSLGQEKLNFDRDIRPWLGYPAILGSSGFGGDGGSKFVFAMVASDEDALHSFVDSQVGAKKLTKVGTYEGANLYRAGRNSTIAVRGPTLILADSVPDLERAIDTSGSSNKMTAAALGEALAGLPPDQLISIVYSLPAVLAKGLDPIQLRQAKAIPYVAAMRTLAVTVAVADAKNVEFAMRVATDGQPLTAEELPLPDNAPTPTLRVAELTASAFGISDLSHMIEFALQAAERAQPDGFDVYKGGLARLSKQLGLDIRQELLAQFTGQLVSYNEGLKGVLVAELEDARAVASALEKLQPAVAPFFKGAGRPGVKVRSYESEGTTVYELRRLGEPIANYAVVGDDLVVVTPQGDPTSVEERATKTLPTPDGSIVFALEPQPLLAALAQRYAQGAALGALLGPISQVSFAAGMTTEATTATLRIGLG